MATMGTNAVTRSMRWLFIGIAALGLAGCGGGGDSAAAPSFVTPTWTQGSYAAASSFSGQCAAPRSGINPATGVAYVDKQGSTTLENFWIRSWTHELYLWYGELPDLNPANYSSTESYFDLLKSSTKDKSSFHFTYPTDVWNALSQSGVSVGYGVEWSIVANAPPRVVVAAYTDPGTPAAANITRGARVLSVDGVDIVNNNTLSAWPEGLYPDNAGESHSFLIQELNGIQHTITMTSVNVTATPVQNVQVIQSGSSKVGYMLFNEHIATSEQQLISAFNTFSQAGVNDLVLDLRYNGGGYLAIASEVAYMVAGSVRTSGKVFDRLVFNSQYPSNTNPVTGGTNTPTPFYSTALGLSAASGTPLPVLNLSTVYVITGRGTCSASEAIINGLRGAGVQVIQIGSTTCGKPYGFYPQDNCGTTYFNIEFQGVNNLGFGDYASGFSPQNTTSNVGVTIPGCSVADDFTHALGDQSEGRLSSALYYQAHQSCLTAATGSSRTQIQAISDGIDLSATEGDMIKEPWRENLILGQ